MSARLHVRERGAGPPLLLGHGLLLDGGMWDAVAERLARRWRVLQVDLRCHGASDKVAEPFSLEDMADDVLALADRLGLAGFAWAGLSMGGMVGMRLALRAPDRVRALALLDTSAAAEARRPVYEVWAESARDRPAGDADVEMFLGLILSPAFAARAPDQVARLGAVIRANDPAAIHQAILAVIRRPSILDRLGAIRAPTVVIVGDRDVATPPAESEAIAAAIPGATLHVLAGAGHLCAAERPEEVAPLIETLLEATR